MSTVTISDKDESNVSSQHICDVGEGGYFITSGIIDFKEDQVKEAIEKAGLTVVEINHQGEWVNITAQKR